MPYIVSFLAGIVSWNIFEKKTENNAENPIVKVVTSVVIMYFGYKFLKKLK